MRDGLRERTVALLKAHQFEYDWLDGGRWCCSCGRWCDSGPGENRVRHNFAEHVADAVFAALNLREEWGNTWAGQGPAINRTREEAERALVYAREQFPDADYVHSVVRRWVSGWSVVDGEQP